MVTLLLTFFVMLLSLADVQDPELFNKGRDAFLESIAYIGLGSLFGKNQTPPFGDHKTRYFVPEPDESADRRTIDAKSEELHRILDKLRQTATLVPSRVMTQGTRFTVANVHFAQGRADLNEQARQFLAGFCRDLQQDTDNKPVELYVVGLVADSEISDLKSEISEQWFLSAQRAQAVAGFLQNALSAAPVSGVPRSPFREPSRWSVQSWGAGPGGNWAGPDGPISAKSQILIGILRSDR